MIRFLVFLMLAAVGLGAADTPYSGTWEAKFKDSVFLILKVQPGEKIEGTMQSGNVRIGEDGELIEAQLGDKESPLRNATVEDGKLAFEVADEGDDDPVRFEMKVTGEGEADLQITGAPMTVKPFHVKRR
jgi:hypothetical protein